MKPGDREPLPPDDDDLTRALDGWQPGIAGRPAAADPTRALDGWVPGGGAGRPAGGRSGRDDEVRIELPPMVQRVDDPFDETIRLRGAGDFEDVEPLDDVTDITDVIDVIDVAEVREARDAPPPDWQPQAAGAEAAIATDRVDDAWQPGAVVVSPRSDPRVIEQWQPGAWVGAVKRVFGAVTDIVSTPNGPVVDVFPPHVLLALWTPQTLTSPFVARFPLRVCLSAAEPEDAGRELLACMPPQALLWMTTPDIDWAFVADLVLHHDKDLRPFQVRELKAFIDAEREAAYTRLNRGYMTPGPGQPLLRTEDANAAA